MEIEKLYARILVGNGSEEIEDKIEQYKKVK